MADNNGAVSVSITTPSQGRDNGQGGIVRVTIQDEASLERLVQFEVPAGIWFQMQTGLMQTVPAQLTEQPERIGKTRERLTVRVGEKGFAPTHDQVVEAFAQTTPKDWGSFEDYAIRNTTSGVFVDYFTWE